MSLKKSTKKLISSFKKSKLTNPKHRQAMQHLRSNTKRNPSKAKAYRWAHAYYG